MFNISDYLKRAVGIIDKDVLYRQEITAIIKKHTSIYKEGNFFEIRDRVLRTQVSPAEKGLLLMKREVLLKDLEKFGIKDIY